MGCAIVKCTCCNASHGKLLGWLFHLTCCIIPIDLVPTPTAGGTSSLVLIFSSQGKRRENSELLEGKRFPSFRVGWTRTAT